VSGQLSMYHKDLNNPNAKVEKVVMREGDLMTHGHNEAHALVADEDTVFLAFADGLRGGEDYEKDTYRLEVPLQDEYAKQ
jgi:hypothetical protein